MNDIFSLGIQNNKGESIFKFLNIAVLSFSIGFAENIIIFPFMDYVKNFIGKSFPIFKSTKKIQLPHKKYVKDSIKFCLYMFQEKGVNLADHEVVIDEDSIFDAYLNKYANDNELERMFFISSRRHMFIASLKVTYIALLVTLLLFAYSLFKGNCKEVIVGTFLFMSTLTIMTSFFKNQAKKSLNLLRPFEIILLTSMKPNLQHFVSDIIKEIILGRLMSTMLSDDANHEQIGNQINLVKSLNCDKEFIFTGGVNEST